MEYFGQLTPQQLVVALNKEGLELSEISNEVGAGVSSLWRLKKGSRKNTPWWLYVRLLHLYSKTVGKFGA